MAGLFGRVLALLNVFFYTFICLLVYFPTYLFVCSLVRVSVYHSVAYHFHTFIYVYFGIKSDY